MRSPACAPGTKAGRFPGARRCPSAACRLAARSPAPPRAGRGGPARQRGVRAGRPPPRGAARPLGRVPARDRLLVAFLTLGGETAPWGVVWGHPGEAPRLATTPHPPAPDRAAPPPAPPPPRP